MYVENATNVVNDYPVSEPLIDQLGPWSPQTRQIYLNLFNFSSCQASIAPINIRTVKTLFSKLLNHTKYKELSCVYFVFCLC